MDQNTKPPAPRLTRRVLFLAGPWLVFVLLSGFLLDAVLSVVPTEGHGLLRASFGAACAMSAFVLGRFGKGDQTGFGSPPVAAVFLLTLAFLTIAGTLVPAPADLHRSFSYAGCLGLVAGSMAISLSASSVWSWRRAPALTIHLAVLLVLIGAAVDAATGRQGFALLAEGGQTSHFIETYGRNAEQTGQIYRLPEPLTVERLVTNYHPPRFMLHLVADGGIRRSWKAREGLRIRAGGRTFDVVSVAPEGRIADVAVPSQGPTGLSAVRVEAEGNSGNTSGWLFAERDAEGVLSGADGLTLVRLFREAPEDASNAFLEIDGARRVWRLPGLPNATWRPLPAFLRVMAGDTALTIRQFIPEARRKPAIVTSPGGVPLVELKKQGDPDPIILSATHAAGLAVDEGGLFLVPQVLPGEPRGFTASVETASGKQMISVNKPLALRSCRVYLSDLSGEPALATLFFNCGFGGRIAQAGLMLLAAALALSALGGGLRRGDSG